jgi:hypothetical protein
MGDWKNIGNTKQNEGSFQFTDWGTGLAQLAKQLSAMGATAYGGGSLMGAIGGAGGSAAAGGSEMGSLFSGSEMGSLFSGLGDTTADMSFGLSGSSGLSGLELEELAGTGMGDWVTDGTSGKGMMSKLGSLLSSQAGNKVGNNQSSGMDWSQLRALLQTMQNNNSSTPSIQPLSPMRSII